MKKIKKILISLIMISFVYSCNSLSDAGKVLRNEKITNQDEFLVKKKEPLSLPPDYDTLPKPGSSNTSKNIDSNKIEKMLKTKDEEASSSSSSSSLEDSVLKQIRN